MRYLVLINVSGGCSFVIWSGRSFLAGEPGWWVLGLLGVVMLAVGIVAGRPWAVDDEEAE